MDARRFPENPVLLVDEEKSVIDSLGLVLRSNGIENIVNCMDSREAMGIIRGSPVDVVLLDLTMPHIPGQELLKSIHEEFPQIPVIVVTAGSASHR